MSNDITKEDLEQSEAKLRARGYYRLNRRGAGYLLMTRTDAYDKVTARIIIPFKEKLAEKAEMTIMEIDFGSDDFAWVHPDHYAEKKTVYVEATPDFVPEVTAEIDLTEVEDVGVESMAKVLEEATEIKIEKTETVEELFGYMSVEDMRKKCKFAYNYKLPKTIKSKESAIKNIKKFLED